MRRFLWLGCIVGSGAFAVETSSSSPVQRYSLVGIISETKANATGIAVLRDEVSQRTLTLRSGEFLPGDTAFQLHTVEKKQVILSDGNASIALTFGGRSKDSQDTEEAAAEEAAKLAATVADAEKDIAEKSRISARAENLSKIIWPGENDTVSFEEIEAYNKFMQKQFPSTSGEVGLEEVTQSEENTGGEASGH